MLGVDTNILLRLILQDDQAQLDVVRGRMARATIENETVHIGPIVLAEAIWTLVKVAKAPKARVVKVISELGETSPFRFFDDDVVAEALVSFNSGNAGFSDCLIHAMDDAAGCQATLTFDTRALTLPGFAHPSAA